jgi:hypothetical protein
VTCLAFFLCGLPKLDSPVHFFGDAIQCRRELARNCGLSVVVNFFRTPQSVIVRPPAAHID